MQIRLSCNENDAVEQLAATLAAVGWELTAGGQAPWRLTAAKPVGAPTIGEAGWLVVEPGDAPGSSRVTVWLPDDGNAIARERLETAIESLAEHDGEASGESAATVRRLRRIEGQIRGLQRMILEGRDCEAVMTQMSAATNALKQTAARLVSQHLVECLRKEIETGGDITQLNQRLLNVLF